MQPFQYDRHLMENEIRLLHVKSAKGQSTLQCELHRHILDLETSYTALSYTWGSTEKSEQIIINGAVMNITRSACDAIKNISSFHDDLVVWVDAICINQEDMLERNAQVRLMANIYGHASMVYAWLGEPAAGFEYSMCCLEQLCEVLNCYESAETRLALVASVWQFVAYILSFDWFRRLWIIQEVALAKCCVLVMGKQYFSIQCLFDIINVLFMDEWNQITSQGFNAHDIASSVAPVILLNTLRSRISNSEWPTLLWLLQNAVGRACSDDRDRVYGLLGLLGSESPVINVDYSKDFGSIFSDAVINEILRRDRALQLVLCSCERRPDLLNKDQGLGNDKLPSWLPDTVVETGMSVFRPEHYACGGLDRIEDRSQLFSQDRKTLILSGKIFAKVVATRGASIDWSSDEIARTILDQSAPLHLTSQLYGNEQEREMAYFRTRVMDIEVATSSSLARRLPASDREFNDGFESRKADHYQTFSFELGRSFVFLDTGHVGITNVNTRPNDLVLIARGIRMPLIVRPCSSGQMTYVAPIYIHGIMDGEAISHEQAESQWKTFTIN